MEIISVRATPLTATWEQIFGSSEGVPKGLRNPAASHVSFPRIGQFSTLVEIETAEGFSGIGECYGLPDPEITALIVERILAPAIVSNDAFETRTLWDRMMELPRGMGFTRGFFMQAVSGIDMALWDLKARALGLPLARLLGGETGRKIPCYASPVPYKTTPEESAEAAESFVSAGFDAVKLKIGRGVETDVKHVAAVREAVGDEVKLLLDCNCAYRVAEAVELARKIEPHDIYWLEEPLHPEDVSGMVQLRKACGLRLAAGENEFTLIGARELIGGHAIDVLMPNLARAGGITGALQLASYAEAHGVAIAPHGVGSAVTLAATLHYMGAIPNGLIYEYNQLPNPLRDDLGYPKPRFSNGAISLPDGDGIGITLVPELLAKYSHRAEHRQDAR